MNLFVFYESSRSAVYGIGTYIRELTDALRQTSMNVCIINLKSDKSEIQKELIDGVWHWCFPASLLEIQTTSNKKQVDLYYRNIVYLLQLYIEDKRNLIFHLNNNHSSKLTEELKNVFNCRIVSSVHYSNWGSSIYDNLQRLHSALNVSEDHPEGFEKRLKKKFEEEKSYFSKMDRIVCLSNYMCDSLYQDYKVELEKLSVIPNGLTDTAETKPDVKLLRKKWNIPLREKIILFAGRMDEIKGLEYLLKAFRMVLQTYPRCRLAIAGSGSFEKYTKESHDICTKITYAGLLDKPQLYEWYSLADVGVVPSLFEPFGYVAVEMMMHGLPIVATATSGLNEVVDDTCGLKVPLARLPDKVEIDTTLLAQKILYLLQHPAQARKMGRNGRKRYLKEYSLGVFRKNMLKFYTSLYDTENNSSDMGRAH